MERWPEASACAMGTSVGTWPANASPRLFAAATMESYDARLSRWYTLSVVHPSEATAPTTESARVGSVTSWVKGHCGGEPSRPGLREWMVGPSVAPLDVSLVSVVMAG